MGADIAVKLGLWAIGIFGGAHALENVLENYIMDHIPAKFKGLVVPVVSLVFAVVGGVQGGLSFGEALTAGLGLAGLTTRIHNDPATTSADLVPPPPLP